MICCYVCISLWFAILSISFEHKFYYFVVVIKIAACGMTCMGCWFAYPDVYHFYWKFLHLKSIGPHLQWNTIFFGLTIDKWLLSLFKIIFSGKMHTICCVFLFFLLMVIIINGWPKIWVLLSSLITNSGPYKSYRTLNSRYASFKQFPHFEMRWNLLKSFVHSISCRILKPYSI